MSRYGFLNGVLVSGVLCVGCGTAPPPEHPAATAPVSTPADAAPASTDAGGSPHAEAANSPPMIPSISLGEATGASATSTTTEAAQQSAERKRQDLLAAMKPLQVMLGQWRGTTQKEVGDFKALDEPKWVWDFQTNREQPAMVMVSEASPYFREARLTYLTDRGIYQLTATDPQGEIRVFEGKFSQPAVEFQGDDQKMHVKYKLLLTQTNAASERDRWQITFNQQENNRYLVELARKRGSRFLRFDTVATQRQGTSFAKSDVDYGNRECIISGGLGTIQVSYNGKSYWVCCTGCKAAFDEDPTTWLAEYEKKKGTMK